MIRRWSIRIALGAGLLLAACAMYAGWSYSAGAEPYGSPSAAAIELSSRLRSWPEHDALYPSGTDPYPLEIDHDPGALLYYGAKHSRDPDHPQRIDIEKKWRAFKPTVALCEGRSRGYMIGELFEPFAGLPEPALVHRLARRDGIPLYSLEPPYETEVAELLERWPADLVALFFTTRVYWSQSQGRPDDRLAAKLLARRTDVAGLRGAVASVEQMDQVWRTHFPELPSWRSRKTEPDHPFFTLIGDASREIRGEHMVRTLVDLVRKGERVMAVVGCSHVIRQEWMLRAALRAPSAPDQLP